MSSTLPHLEIVTDNSESSGSFRRPITPNSSSEESPYRLSNYYFGKNSTRSSNNSERANFTNTSHVVGGRPETDSRGEKSLNQVPQRFSQFILHDSATDRSDLPNREGISPNSRRDISDLMGSQATIFSTKGDKPRGKPRSPTRMLPHSARKNSENPVLLTRKSALKYKLSTVLNRIRKRLRRMANRISTWSRRAFVFVTRRKGTARTQFNSKGSILHRKPSVRRALSTTSRKQISGPLNNPNLGQPADRVDKLAPEIKALVQPHLPYVPHLPHQLLHQLPHLPHDLPRSHILSRYMSEQSIPIAHKPFQAPEVEGPPPPPHKVTASLESQRLQMAWRQYLANVLAQRIQLRQEIHMFQALLAGHNVPPVFKSGASVVSSIRAEEVVASENSHEDEDTYSGARGASGTRGASGASGAKPTMSMSHSLISVSDSVLSDTDAASLPGELSDSDYDWDEGPHVEKLNSALNRRSVLGEMLDYDSDDKSSASSCISETYINSEEVNAITPPESIAMSRANSQMIKRYGTIKRHVTPVPTTPSSKYSSDDHGSPDSPPPSSPRKLPRSTGVHLQLNLVCTSEL